MTNHLEPPINFSEAEAVVTAISKPEVEPSTQTARDLYIPPKGSLVKITLDTEALNDWREVFPSDTPQEIVVMLMRDALNEVYYQLEANGYYQLAEAAALSLADR